MKSYLEQCAEDYMAGDMKRAPARRRNLVGARDKL